MGTQSNSLGQEGKTLQRVRGRGRNSEGPRELGRVGGGRKQEGEAGQFSGSALWISILVVLYRVKYACKCTWIHMHVELQTHV